MTIGASVASFADDGTDDDSGRLSLNADVLVNESVGTGTTGDFAGAYRPDSEKSTVVPRYLVGPHPYGEAPDQETFPILAGEVSDVVFEGYTDEADAAFLDDLLEQK